jgi:hypothetical protein
MNFVKFSFIFSFLEKELIMFQKKILKGKIWKKPSK